MKMFYPRNVLLARCLWWKSLGSDVQTSRHCYASNHPEGLRQFPLNSSTWKTIKSLGLQKHRRGKSGRGVLLLDEKPKPIKSRISRPLPIELNIQNRFTRSASSTTYAFERQPRINFANLSIPVRIPFTPQVSNSSKLCVLNARSICNKSLLLNDFVVENEIDMLCITETWLKSNDKFTINELTPIGYIFEHTPRKGRGGGVGLLYKKSLHLKKICFTKFKSFEAMGMVIPSSPKHISIFVIYRPPPSNRNNFTARMFFEEFTNFLEQFATNDKPVFLVGDFNFHVGDTSDPTALQFLNILDCFNLVQHVKQNTYQDRHILDLLITGADDNNIDNISVFDPAISDHSAVFCDLNLKKPPFEKIVSKCRRLKTIDFVSFSNEIAESTLLTSPHYNLDGLLNQYNSILISALDNHAPAKDRIITLRPSSPWYTAEIKAEKIKRRRLERAWRKSRLTIDRELYQGQCNKVRDLIKRSKNEFYSGIIFENQYNQKILFSTFDKMINKKTVQHFPSCSSPNQLANSFADFFVNKIKDIQANFDDNLCPRGSWTQHCTGTLDMFLTSFDEISSDDLSKLVFPLVSKSCDLDPVPSTVLKSCFDLLLPTITKIVNLSLTTVTMPLRLKEAIIRPIIKKQNLSPEEYSNFRPISNLNFLSKAIEKVVAIQLIDHLENNNLHEKFQSAYKKHHSVETALLRVQNDILCAIDRRSSVILVLLDLSAAFDTVDHGLLLERLSSKFGVKGHAIKWFKSYLKDRSFRVSVQGGTSTTRNFNCGVPQGSVLGPILFLLYTSPIGDILRSYEIDFHLYADDSQLYITFETSSLVELESAKQRIESCVNEINSWMSSNKLKLNADKTEVIVLTASHCPRPSIDFLKFSDFDIFPTSNARNIGVVFDENVSMQKHITSICKSCFFHLKNIWKIRKYLSFDACETLVHALISSRLDFCNSLLYGLPKSSLHKLQIVQNSAARVISYRRKQDHKTPVLCHLHWLPVEERIEFKILILAFKALNDVAPSYISDLLKPYIPSRSLRSSSSNLLTKTSFNLKTYGKRAFSHAAPELWNKLPPHIRSCKTLSSFKRELKTWLFRRAYDMP